MNIDVTITAVIRPDILERTLDSFFHNVFSKGHSYTAIVNVDPIGDPFSNASDVFDVVGKYFDQVCFHAADQPNFAKAVRWVWSHTQADFVFHLEDMWLSMVPIEFDDLVHVMATYEKLASINLHKYVLADGSPPPVFYPSYSDSQDKKKFLRIDRPILSPGLYRGIFIRQYSLKMNESDNPELQIWGDRDFPRDQQASTDNIAYLRSWDYALYTGNWRLPFWSCRKAAVNMFQGRRWKKANGFVKENHFSPWKNIEK